MKTFYICILLLFTIYCVTSYPSYDLEVFLNFTDTSPYVDLFGEHLEPEDIIIAPSGIMYITRHKEGSIFKSDKDGNLELFTQFTDISDIVDINGITLDNQGNLYVCVNEFFEFNDTLSAITGIWKINKDTDGICNFQSTDCYKIFPLHGEEVSYLNSIVISNDNHVYVSDTGKGGIWKFSLDDSNPGYIWSGTDANSSPNYMSAIGIFGPPGDSSNPEGRGFGINGITIDPENKIIYGVNFELGLVFKVPILQDGSAGMQELLYSKTFQYIFDGIYYDRKILYVSLLADLTQGLQQGQRLLAADLTKRDLVFETIIDDSLLGTATNIVSGRFFGENPDVLYITDINGRNLSESGSKIVKATPTN